MKHKDVKPLLPAYLEDQLQAAVRDEVAAHLQICVECQKEAAQLDQLEEVLNKMKLKKPSKNIWDEYWSSVYNRLERRIGWILLSIGLITLIIIGATPAIKTFIIDPEIPVVIKIGLLFLTIGGIIIFVSILREQLFFRKRERYKEVEK
jgi:hypothetical protein